MSSKVDVLKDVEQISNHFGRGADVASLTKGAVTGPSNYNEAISIATDIAKVAWSYAKDAAKKTDAGELVTNVGILFNSLDVMRQDYLRDGTINAGPVIKAISTVGWVNEVNPNN